MDSINFLGLPEVVRAQVLGNVAVPDIIKLSTLSQRAEKTVKDANVKLENVEIELQPDGPKVEHHEIAIKRPRFDEFSVGVYDWSKGETDPLVHNSAGSTWNGFHGITVSEENNRWCLHQTKGLDVAVADRITSTILNLFKVESFNLKISGGN